MASATGCTLDITRLLEILGLTSWYERQDQASVHFLTRVESDPAYLVYAIDVTDNILAGLGWSRIGILIEESVEPVASPLDSPGWKRISMEELRNRKALMVDVGPDYPVIYYRAAVVAKGLSGWAS